MGTKRTLNFKKSLYRKRDWKTQLSPREKLSAWGLLTVDTNRAGPPTGLSLGSQVWWSQMTGVWHQEFAERFDGKTCHPWLHFLLPGLTALWISFLSWTLSNSSRWTAFPQCSSIPLNSQRQYQLILAHGPRLYFRNTPTALVMAICQFV